MSKRNYTKWSDTSSPIPNDTVGAISHVKLGGPSVYPEHARLIHEAKDHLGMTLEKFVAMVCVREAASILGRTDEVDLTPYEPDPMRKVMAELGMTEKEFTQWAKEMAVKQLIEQRGKKETPQETVIDAVPEAKKNGSGMRRKVG